MYRILAIKPAYINKTRVKEAETKFCIKPNKIIA